ncbi:hypothetical protein BSIN_4399 [Burkholderia singularis]|uniref:Uncharacterized protein n=1 Tax=Burkholderia singularis TaxID=1503053 RepID=A0A238H866_9BURK|nr:hypothetical protein BSIN_4399 [Burkholderia singularis]
MRLYIENILPTLTRDALRDFIFKYTKKHSGGIRFVAPSASSSNALTEIDGVGSFELAQMRGRWHDMYWTGCRITRCTFAFWDFSYAADLRHRSDRPSPGAHR